MSNNAIHVLKKEIPQKTKKHSTYLLYTYMINWNPHYGPVNLIGDDNNM